MFPPAFTPTPLEPSLEPTPFSIIHWTQGRIRLRVPRLAQEPGFVTHLERSLQADPLVTEVCFNEAARSVTVHYAAERLSAAALWERLTLVLQQAVAPLSEPYATKALAQRLGVPFQTLNWRRNRVDFAEWSRSKDPQSIGWRYDAGAKCFYSCPAIAASTPPATGHLTVERIFQSLRGAIGERLGGLLGRAAGEAIGLALLGTAGVIVGAEIGMIIGEIVGEELGSV
jgi:hypothetical protein